MIVGGASGVGVAALVLIDGASWSVAALFASDVAAAVFVIWVWSMVGRLDARATSRIARAEDPSRAASETVLVCAAAASLMRWGSRWRRPATPAPPSAKRR